MEQFDVVIIGSGLGGLECGVILSKEGYSVCVLEQSSAFGGCFQSFERCGKTIDTGIHYVGSMGEGQTLNQFFKYFGIIDSLKLQRLDEDSFDVIHLGEEKYDYAQGYERFYETLAERFSHEKEGLKKYCQKIKEIGSQIAVKNLHNGMFSTGGIDYLGVSGSSFIESCVSDERLRNVLAGNNVLYAGIRDVTTLYHHAMINHSNIEGAYRFADGTQSVIDSMVDVIQRNGGESRARSRVTKIMIDDGKASGVELENGEQILGKYIISNAHPAVTFDLVENTPLIKKAYRTRFKALPNSYGMISAYMLMKPQSFPYINKNHYLYNGSDVWDVYSDRIAPKLTFFSCQAYSKNQQYSEVATLMSPMFAPEFEKWTDTKFERRGDEYIEYKERKAREMIKIAAREFPDIENCIEQIVVTTPLSYRDYTSVPDGSAYGIVKNCHSPLISLIPVRTKIPNLLLTGQNLNVHGALGVTLTAAMTCSELIGAEYLAKKIAEV